MSKKLTVRDLDLAGKRVLVRVDFNVPLKDGDDGTRIITDDTRIQAALPTVRFLLEAGASVVLMSHLGRPKGERKPEFSLKPVAGALEEIFPGKVRFIDDCIGEAAEAAANDLSAGDILLLENLRYHAAETANDAEFAGKLASLADLYVNDAFGTAHRAHASTAGVAAHLPQAAMGLLLERELEYLNGKLEDPEKPFVVILGGKKVSDKIGVIDALMDKADTILIGGAMQYAFRKAQGHEIGESYLDPDDVPIAKALLEKAEAGAVNLVLPVDSLEADDFSNEANMNNIEPYAEGGAIREGWEGLDIGERATREFCEIVSTAKTILWNGPMGVFEIEAFGQGTKLVAEAVAKADALTIIGGGDSVTAVKKFGVAEEMTFISTGGGASLELLEGKELPGFAALTDLA